MKRARLAAALVAVAAVAAGLTAADAQHSPVTATAYDCATDNHTALGSTCFNSGGHAHGVMVGCTYPRTVVIQAGYYGHVYIKFWHPVSSIKHFFYGGAPDWDLAWFDPGPDAEHAPLVEWSVGGPPQDYVGQRHVLYAVRASCDPDDKTAP